MAKNMYQKRKERQLKINEKNDDKGGLQKTDINWYPGHMAKTKREIKEKLNLIDIVIEIIDARIPLSSKNKDVDELIKNKPRILVMTKKDLCDINITNKWKSCYESLGYKVILTDLLKDNTGEIIKEINNINNELNKNRLLKGLKERNVRVLVLGIPNVGKSTLINRLVNKKATNVGNRPGITKQLQWIRINKDIELLDTPGILWPKLDNEEIALNLASMTAIKEEVLNSDEVALHIIKKMIKYYPLSINDRYNLNGEKELISILDLIGKKQGSIRNGEVDYDKVYNTILKDLRDGYLGRITFDWR